MVQDGVSGRVSSAARNDIVMYPLFPKEAFEALNSFHSTLTVRFTVRLGSGLVTDDYSVYGVYIANGSLS